MPSEPLPASNPSTLKLAPTLAPTYGRRRKRLWLVGGLGVLVVWCVVVASIMVLNRVEPTPASVIAMVEERNWEQATPDDRMAWVIDLTDHINRLPPDARFDPELGRRVRQLFTTLSAQEQTVYLDRTLPTGFEQMMTAFNAMSTEQRQTLVDQALKDLDRDMADGSFEIDELNEAHAKRIINEGMKSYLKDSSAQAKLDLQPLILRVQALLQGGRQ